MSKPKVQNDKAFINGILAKARQQGVEERVKNILAKCEDNVKGCRSDIERKHIVHLALIEIHKTIGCVGPLVVDGIELLPADPSYQEAIDWHKGLVRLD
jgi:hypothetical protein